MDDFAKMAKEEIEKALLRRGKANILAAGKTGVGKSTLINAIFDGNLATTGQGRPITAHTREIRKEGIPVAIFDSRGLEVADYQSTISGLESFLKERQRNDDPNQHLHAAWICIVEDSHRVEQAESQLATVLATYMPTVAVITKAKSDNGFRNTVQDLLPEAKNVIRVRAISTTLDDGHLLHPMGLEELVDATMEVVPEGQRNAVAATQRVSLKYKANRAHAIVASAASAATGIGAAPIPFSDAIAIIPIQVSMLAGISAVWGLPLSTSFLSTIVTGAITAAGGTVAGRAVVGALLKLIPGAGTIMGGVISASTAALLTTVFGEAYVTALSFLGAQHPISELTPEQIRDEFMRQLKKKPLPDR